MGRPQRRHQPVRPRVPPTLDDRAPKRGLAGGASNRVRQLDARSESDSPRRARFGESCREPRLPAEAVLASDQNIENNPMHSSLAVAGRRGLAKTPCLVEANHWHYSIIASPRSLSDAYGPAGSAVWRDRTRTCSTTIEVAPARHREESPQCDPPAIAGASR